MNPRTSKDSVFSSGKPKNLPWFFIPLILTVVGLVLLFDWFN